MKHILLVIILLSAAVTFAQFRDSGFETNSVKEGIVTENSNSLFGFLNSDDFIMRHSFSLNYSTFAGQGMSLTSYTNSMFYRLMNNLNVQVDVSVMYSPYSTLGEQFQKDISGVYISNAAINYHPWDNFSVHLQYRSMPFGYGYYHPFYGYGNPFNFSSGLNSYQSESPFQNK
ncbi:MAG TPA: hypothetical protein VIZ21_03515 [Ignavibacteriaceae bacterium]